MSDKGKKSKGKIIAIVVVIVCVLICGLLAAGAIHYFKDVLPDKEINKIAGYDSDDYVKLGKYKNFTYVITQKKFDDLLKEKTFSSKTVKRAAKKGDEIEVSYTAYIDGKKVDDLSQKNVGLDSTNNTLDVYNKFIKATIGESAGDEVKVKVSGKEASKISKAKKKYKDDVDYKIKVVGVSEVNYADVTDKWVNDESDEDVTNAKDFYLVMEAQLEENAKADLWQRAIDNATMTSWPPKLYDAVKDEAEADARYSAAQWKMSLDDWYKMNNQTKESLDEEYMNSVKSTLVMWSIVKEENIKVTSKDIEERYKELFEELKEDGEYNSLKAVKKDYSVSEIREAVYLDKAQELVFDSSNIEKTYKVPAVK